MASETKQAESPKEVRYNDVRADVEVVGGHGYARLMGFDRLEGTEGDVFGKALVNRYNFHERLVEALRGIREELSFIHEAPEAIPGMIQACSVITTDGSRLLAESRTLLSEISKAAE